MHVSVGCVYVGGAGAAVQGPVESLLVGWVQAGVHDEGIFVYGLFYGVVFAV